jgi:hypothetical protein
LRRNFHRKIFCKLHFPNPKKIPARNHVPTSKSPQLHHKKPSRKRHFSQKPPQKTRSNRARKKTVTYPVAYLARGCVSS